MRETPPPLIIEALSPSPSLSLSRTQTLNRVRALGIRGGVGLAGGDEYDVLFNCWRGGGM